MYTILTRDLRRRRTKISTRIENKDDITLVQKISIKNFEKSWELKAMTTLDYIH